MKTSSIMVSTAITSLLALGAATVGMAASADEGAAAKEKCYGVAQAGENSCAGNGHSCQGQAKTDKDPGEWKYVARGQCAELGGSTAPGKQGA